MKGQSPFFPSMEVGTVLLAQARVSENRPRFFLSFQAAAGYTIDDVLAGEEEEDQHRQDDDGAAAIMTSFRAPPSVTKLYRPKGSVRTFAELVASIGQRKEFQLAMAFSRMMVTSEGLAIGTMILQRYFQSEHPSTRAA